MATANDFKKFNVRGGVTYSQFTMPQAIANNDRSNFPKTPDKIAPTVQLLLDEQQYTKLAKHITDVYLPEAVRRQKAGEKRDAFDQKTADKIARALADRDFEGPPHLPVKAVYAKTLDVAPWAVATVKFAGSAGRDIEQLARVNDEDELKVPDPNLIQFPALKPIEATKHELYPGAWAYATLNLSGFVVSSSNYGISAYSNTVVFLEDRDRLAGGTFLDEDDVFMDD